MTSFEQTSDPEEYRFFRRDGTDDSGSMREASRRTARTAARLLACPFSLVWVKSEKSRVVLAAFGLSEDDESQAIQNLASLCDAVEDRAEKGELSSTASLEHAVGSTRIATALRAPLFDENRQVVGGIIGFDSLERTWNEGEAGALEDLAEVSGRAILREQMNRDSARERSALLGSLELCPYILLVFDLKHGRALHVNRKVADELGYPPESLVALGTKVAATLLHPLDLPRHLAHLEVVRNLKQGAWSAIDLRLMHADGTWRWFTVSSAGFAWDESGQAVESLSLASEISERKASHVALERYRLLSQHVRDIILFYRVDDGRIVEANAAAKAAYGLTREVLLASTITDLVAPNANDEHPSPQAIEDWTQLQYESTHRRRDGSTFPVEITSVAADVSEERLILSLVRDISDRKALERAGKLEEQRYRLAVEAAFGICYEIDLENDIEYARISRIHQFLGDPVEEIGQTFSWWLNRIHPEDRTQVTKTIGKYDRRTDFHYHFEYRIRHATGEYLWVLDRGFQFSDDRGRPVRRIGCVMDITDRKEAERALLRQGERLRILSASVGHLLTSDQPRLFIARLFDEIASHLDLEYYFNYVVNDDGTKLHLDSSRGVPEDLLARIQDLEFGEAVCGAVALSRKPELHGSPAILDEPRLEPFRSLGMTAYASFPLVAGDRLLGTLGFGTSKRDLFTPEEVGLLHGICDRVGLAMERLDLLNQSRIQAERLREDDRRKDEFLAMLAHELRNPIAAIQGASQLLALSDLPQSELDWSREVIDRQVVQLARLIEDLLDVSRMTRGKIRLRKQAVDLRAIIDRALDSTSLAVERKDQSLVLDIVPSPLPVWGDPARLEQILVNLLSNASKYTDAKGKIGLEAVRDESHIFIRVKDNGIGIPQAMIHRIFETFTQVEDTLDRQRGGLGIGLALVKHLTQMHGGTISASSAGEGRGSEFLLKLPVDMTNMGVERELPPLAPGEKSTPPKRKISVLVVDDIEDVALTLARTLQLSGFDTSVAFDGFSALREARALKPDVLILDIGLPGLNGYELAETLTKSDGMTNALFIACTGYGQAQAFEKSLASGFQHHLIKPVDHEKLLQLIRSSINPK